jgi:hypothetical protein
MRRRPLYWVAGFKRIFHSFPDGLRARGQVPQDRIDNGNDHYQPGEQVMSKSQDSKKNVKKAPTKTPKEKKEAKRLKKAEKKF